MRSSRVLHVAALALMVGCADAGERAPSPSDQAFAATVALGRAYLQAHDVPGMTLAVVVDGRLRYAAGLGVTRYRGSTPVTVDTRFAWYSITKMHTAAAAVRLAEAGRLDLDAPVSRLVPELTLEGAGAEGITTRQLLDHTSGLPSGFGTLNAQTDCAMSLGAFWASRAMTMQSRPGEVFVYNGMAAFSLASLVVERAAGRSFVDAMESLIFEPSGMRTATFDPQEARAAPHTAGTYWNRGNPTVQEIEPSWTVCPLELGPGGMVATASDIARTIELHIAGGGALWTRASETSMRSQVDTRATPDGESRYGLGLYRSVRHGVEVLHAWGWGDHRALVIMAPTLRWGIAVSTNAEWNDPGEVAWAALDLFFPALPDQDPSFATDPNTWAIYEGQYVDENVLGALSVTRVDRALRLATGWGETFALTQVAGDLFRAVEPSGAMFQVQFGPRPSCYGGRPLWLAISASPESPHWPTMRLGVARRADVGC